ncbi:hypothetical protein KIH86_13275 [Paenibacillus sp. HN-1]|uniref:DUF3999 domain-containing protein n=1 Tax=Paenibacillus TaxID=44249 RepID=UPI001CA96E68|nr:MULTISPECIES: DUF3999 domain-containing protein [Paenibacillus]MBY9080809.1 hypothetical protein [Paenibacillus sp. CGMCC 1.18879]MBY9085199.1 hypothetical protein [Paenibacillus sinensis]
MEKMSVCRRISLLAAALGLWAGIILPPQAQASSVPQPSEDAWTYKRPIETSTSGAYLSLYLDNEIYAKSDSGLADLRIVDSEGRFIPYYIESGTVEAAERTVTYTAQLVHTERQQKSTSFDYAINPLKPGTDIQGNRLLFTLPDASFLKHVVLYGSYDGMAWEKALQDDLYRTGQVDKSWIDLGAALKYSYYRLTVLDNAENLSFPAPRLVHQLTEVKSLDFSRTGAPRYEIKEEDGETRIVIDNRDRLKIKRIKLESEGIFLRRYDLQDREGSIIPVEGSGELYRMEFKDTRIAGTDIVTMNPVNSPALTLTIYNKDDAPLALTGIETEYLVDKLIFADNGKGPYHLLYGNPDAAAPEYDIVNFKTQISQETLGDASLGDEILKQTAQPVPENGPPVGKLIFNILIVVVSLLLVFILIRKAKKV